MVHFARMISLEGQRTRGFKTLDSILIYVLKICETDEEEMPNISANNSFIKAKRHFINVISSSSRMASFLAGPDLVWSFTWRSPETWVPRQYDILLAKGVMKFTRSSKALKEGKPVYMLTFSSDLRYWSHTLSDFVDRIGTSSELVSVGSSYRDRSFIVASLRAHPSHLHCGEQWHL